MRKWIFILLLVLVVALLGGYYGVGIKAQKDFVQLLDNANQTPNVSIKLVNYERGWFRSLAEVAITVSKPEQVQIVNGKEIKLPKQEYTIDADMKIDHGPIVFNPNKVAVGLAFITGKINLPEPFKAQFKQMFTEQSSIPQIDTSVFLKFGGAVEHSVRIPAFTLHGKKDNDELKWGGLDSYAYVSSNQSNIKGYLDIYGLTFKSEDADVTMEKASFKYNETLASKGTWARNASLHFPALEVNNKGQKALALTGYDLTFESNIKDELLGVILNVMLKNLTINGTNYGPGDLDFSIKNLDANAFLKIWSELQEADDPKLSAKQQQMMLLGLLPQIPQLLSKGAELELSKLNFNMPQGAIVANAKVSLPEGGVANPMMLLKQVSAKANLQVPVEVVEQVATTVMFDNIQKQQRLQQVLARQMQANTDASGQQEAPKVLTPEQMNQMAKTQVKQQLGQLVQTGLLQEQGGLYNFKLVLENGKVTINGKPYQNNLLP